MIVALGGFTTRSHGRAFVQDPQGRLVGSTNPDLDKVTAVRDRAAAAYRISWEGETYRLLREALLVATGRHLGEGDVIVPVSFDDIAVIRSPQPAADHREEAASFVEAVRGSLDAGIRGDFFFGIGRPTDDPFLLTLSHQEASTAVSALASEGREALSFYEELPKGAA